MRNPRAAAAAPLPSPEVTGSLTIAAWNVNSIKARLANVTAWLEAVSPDILLLQELKCTDDAFPGAEIEALGYQAAVHGQKSYNGVAILARHAIEDVTVGLPGDEEDDQARWIEASIAGLRVASLYLPNGNPAPGPKFDYKLGWMKRLHAHAARLLAARQPVVLGGDYNVIPEPEDCWDTNEWEGDALFRPESRAAFRALTHLGYVEAFRALHPARGAYTFWDYQKGHWQNDQGIRIDHHLLSPEAADRLMDCRIDRSPRGAEKASDHTPIIVELKRQSMVRSD